MVDELVGTKYGIKRNGKKVDFDGSKIAIAIKKGFDSVKVEDEENKYTEKDIQKIYQAVISKIEKLEKSQVKIEEVQDMIEAELEKKGYDDVYTSFKEYRERRANSRKLFFDEKKSINEIVEEIGVSRQSVSGYLKTVPGYQQERVDRKALNAVKRKEYKKDKNRQYREDYRSRVTSETIKREHDKAVMILSHEKYH